MSTLQELIDLYPTKLFDCTDGVSSYRYSQFIRNNMAVMYDGSEHYLDENKWELVVPSLSELKELKILQIDYKTRSKIEEGFTFDGNIFSLSENAQLNWIGMKGSLELLTFPIAITTKDDNSYNLAEINATNFFGTALATKQAHLTSGRNLKVSIKEATTISELNSIVDAR